MALEYPMTTIRTPLAIIAVIFLVLIGFLTFFTVDEGESALLLRLGKIVSRANGAETMILAPGLHYKIPLIDRVKIFDTRLQELSTSRSKPLMVVTKEQTYLLVDYFAKWRINDLPKFYTSTGGSVSWAETLLEQRLNDIVRAEYGRRTSDEAISMGRTSMMNAIRELANNVGKDQGISVLDVRIQQITLPKEILDSVFKRMATERKQFAEGKRAEGLERSEEIKALADQKVTVIKAEAIKQAATIRAQGDEEAATIYATSYGTNPQFYAYYRSLEAYENSFNQKSDMLLLKPEGQFFTYFHGAKNAEKKR
jgi:modulator of FtsH protease HflC